MEVPDHAIRPEISGTSHVADDLASGPADLELGRAGARSVLPDPVADHGSVGPRVPKEHGVAHDPVSHSNSRVSFKGNDVLPGGRSRKGVDDSGLDPGLTRECAKRPDVVEDPDGPTVRPNDEIVVAGVDDHFTDRNGGDVPRPMDPALTPVQAHIQPQLTAEEQQVRLDGVLFDDVEEIGDAVRGETLPTVTVVLGPVHVCAHVTAPMIVDDDICPSRHVARRLHLGYICGVWRLGQGLPKVRPGRTIVPRELHVPVVRADPDHTWLHWARVDREDRVVVVQTRWRWACLRVADRTWPGPGS